MPNAKMQSVPYTRKRFLVDAIFIVAVISLLIFILLPAFSTEDRRLGTVTNLNLEKLTRACITYANDRSHSLPPNIYALYSSGLLTETRIILDYRLHSFPVQPLPLTPHIDDSSDFFYCGANLNLQLLDHPDTTILFYDKGLRPDFRMAAFADGHVEYIFTAKNKAAQSYITATNAARAAQHLPPLPPDLLSAPQSTTLPSNIPLPQPR